MNRIAILRTRSGVALTLSLALAPFCASCNSGSPDATVGDDAADANVANQDAESDAATNPDADVDRAASPFPIGFWLGPDWDHPDTCDASCLKLFSQAAAAGFTFCAQIGFSQTQIKVQLDAYQSAGMKALVFDARMPGLAWGKHAAPYHPLSAEEKQALDSIVSDWSGHPGFGGYMLGDEPTSDQFPYLGEISAYFAQKDPAHPTYVNLLPNYGVGTSYDAYVESFLTTVKSGIFSYDNYDNGARFFDNLASISHRALTDAVSFWSIVESYPGEAQKRWEAMQALAYGAKGVVFFTYSYFPPLGQPAILNPDNTPSAQYAEVTHVNADVHAMGQYLLDAQLLGSDSALTNPRPSDGSLSFAAPAEVTYGRFRGKAHEYFLFANRSASAATRAVVSLTSAGAGVEHFDKKSGLWSPAGQPDGNGGTSVSLAFAAGDGELYRF